MGKRNRIFHQHTHRLDPWRIEVETPTGVPTRMFAGADVPVEPGGLEQVFALTGLRETIGRLADVSDGAFWGGAPGEVSRMVLTPDFHRGAKIPVGTVLRTRGFVVPQAVGGDICCGMRVLLTDLDADALEGHMPALEQRLRAIFFGGERDLPLSPRQREAMLRSGPWGLLETADENAGVGLWRWYDPDAQLDDLARCHLEGGVQTDGVFSLFADYVQSSGARDGRDAQLGSVGGGNHFVELQRVDEVLDGATAHLWGVEPGKLAIMIHSGSVNFGGLVGRFFIEEARRLYPTALKHPEHGFFMLPTQGPHAAVAARYLDALGNAANFAVANRLFMGLMATRAIEEATGHTCNARLLHDVPHNLVWREREAGVFTHRKGACPAPASDPDRPGPFRYTGPPVIIPGSMGAPSFLMRGLGSAEAMESACHGAGRALSRGAARRVDPAGSARAGAFRVVTPIDPDAPTLRSRPDLLAAYHERVREEQPAAYKPITPIIDTISACGIAAPVACVRPLLTVKG